MTTARERRQAAKPGTRFAFPAVNGNGQKRAAATARPRVQAQACRWLGAQLGSLICNCSGKARIFACSNPETPYGYAIPVEPREWLDGKIRFSDGSHSDRVFLPWHGPEPRDGGIQLCQSCPRRAAPEPPAAPVFEQPRLTALLFGDEVHSETINPEAKICVLTGFTPSGHWAEIGRLTAATMRTYAMRHGYGFRLRTEFVRGIAPSWCKLEFLWDALESHETVLWLDADAAVTNPAVKVESLLSDADLTLCTDPVALNCGCILVRRSQWTSDFLAKVWADRYSKNRLWEQDTVNRLFWRGELADHLRVCAPRAFNSRLPAGDNHRDHDAVNWRPGDFVGHWYNTGRNDQRKLECIRGAISKQHVS